MTAAHGLLAATLARLRADPTLAADLGPRVWDAAPRDPAFPISSSTRRRPATAPASTPRSRRPG